jgi:hypothetical protein
MMDRYLYLILALCFILGITLVYALRSDLRANIIYLMGFGCVWGPISDHWFFMDYWHPTSVVQGAWLEDCLYGAGVAATAGVIHKFVFRRTFCNPPSLNWKRILILPAFALCYILGMIAVRPSVDINSIYLSMVIYIVFAIVILIWRRDLILPSLASAMLMAVVAVAGYGIGLNFFVDGQTILHRIWLLYGHPGGTIILGAVPLSEVLWYACWGSLFGVAFEFVSGSRLSASAFTNSTPSRGATSTIRHE